MKLFKQHDLMDCGPACIRMIAKFYGKNISISHIREKSYLSKQGVSFIGLSHAAEFFGIKSMGAKLNLEQLYKKAPLPCILHLYENHFVVLYKTKRRKFYIADPNQGKYTLSYNEMAQQWTTQMALLLEITPDFYKIKEDENPRWSYFLKYFLPHKNLILQILLALIFSSVVSLITPFITQSVVDIGILGKNLNFIYLVLIAQLAMTVTGTIVSFIQAWISLHLSIRVSLSFFIGYISKLMKMPFLFFETKTIGDILQRIGDNSRIESFISNTFFSILISSLNLVIYTSIMSYYNYKILLIFLLGNFLYIGWILAFMKKRREFDHEGFKIASENQNILLQLFTGYRDIKLNNLEKEKRWDWERVQAKQFHFSVKTTIWEQFQSSGSIIINSAATIDSKNLETIDDYSWRKNCGSVMQESFIFSDTILNNVTLKNYDTINFDNFIKALKIANIQNWVESLPESYNTIIGEDGHGISEGQKQRILISRIIYKNPEIVVFDEATNSLDANNESIILSNIQRNFKNKTIVVIAHRLSSIKNADNILVLKNGNIVEHGDYKTLIKNKAEFFKLIKNQS